MFVLLEKPLNRLPEIIRKQKLVPYRIFNVEPLTYIYIYRVREREKWTNVFKIQLNKTAPPPFFPSKILFKRGRKMRGLIGHLNGCICFHRFWQHKKKKKKITQLRWLPSAREIEKRKTYRSVRTLNKRDDEYECYIRCITIIDVTVIYPKFFWCLSITQQLGRPFVHWIGFVTWVIQ